MYIVEELYIEKRKGTFLSYTKNVFWDNNLESMRNNVNTFLNGTHKFTNKKDTSSRFLFSEQLSSQTCGQMFLFNLVLSAMNRDVT